MIADRSVTRNDAIRTVQFYLLWGILFINVTAGHRHPRAGVADDAGHVSAHAARGGGGRLADQHLQRDRAASCGRRRPTISAAATPTRSSSSRSSSSSC